VSQSKPASPEPTEIAGRYRIIQKLGAGAFGTVFKAKDSILERMVAIKTIRLEGLAAAGADLDELLKRFELEAKNSAKLKHPNIVTIHDLGNADGLSYIAMEFIDGVGLDRMIHSGKLPLERAASLGAQVADALDFAHRHNVVHRDIKPANVMVEAGDRVKVTDFGIAKATDTGDHLTMTGSLLGTPSYMSPEQARGGQIDGRSDLFSLGCVLYEMLAGKKAFRGESITALIFKIITEEPPNIRDLDPDVPDEMVRIITKAISKAPETRYQTGREIADDLLALTRAGSTPTVRQAETPTAKGPAPGGPPTLATPLTVSSSPTAIGGAAPPTRVTTAPPTQLVPPPPAPRAAAPSPAPPRAARPAAAEAPRKSGAGAGLLIALGLAGLLFVGVAAGAGWYFFLRKPAGPTTVTDATAPPDTAPAATVTTLASAPSAEPSAAATPALAPSSAPTPAPREPTAAPTRTGDGTATGRKGGGGSGSTGQPAGQTQTSPGAGGGNDMAFLDSEEPIESDGREAGEALAQKYKSDQGSNRGTTYGTTSRYPRSQRNPRPNNVNELAAIKTLRYVIDSQEAYHRKNGRYGNLLDLFGRTPLDVPHNGDSFQRRGYRYNLEVTGDGYKVTAMPVQVGPRPFTGYDSGIIRPGLE